jgi:hypothetical protein
MRCVPDRLRFAVCLTQACPAGVNDGSLVRTVWVGLTVATPRSGCDEAAPGTSECVEHPVWSHAVEERQDEFKRVVPVAPDPGAKPVSENGLITAGSSAFSMDLACRYAALDAFLSRELWFALRLHLFQESAPPLEASQSCFSTAPGVPTDPWQWVTA